MIKVDVPNKKRVIIFDVMSREGQHSSVVFFPQIYNFNLIMRKHQTNPDGGMLYKTADWYSSNCQGQAVVCATVDFLVLINS